MNWIVERWTTIREAVGVRRRRRAIDGVAAAAVARRADCDYKFNGCDDPRCKIGHCILEMEKRAERAVAVGIDVDGRIKERAWHIARVILEIKEVDMDQVHRQIADQQTDGDLQHEHAGHDH